MRRAGSNPIAATRASSFGLADRGAQASTETVTRAGTTLVAPGSTSSRPAVATALFHGQRRRRERAARIRRPRMRARPRGHPSASYRRDRRGPRTPPRPGPGRRSRSRSRAARRPGQAPAPARCEARDRRRAGHAARSTPRAASGVQPRSSSRKATTATRQVGLPGDLERRDDAECPVEPRPFGTGDRGASRPSTRAAPRLPNVFPAASTETSRPASSNQPAMSSCAASSSGEPPIRVAPSAYSSSRRSLTRSLTRAFSPLPLVGHPGRLGARTSQGWRSGRRR